MVDSLLASLRERVLDESEPLAGLLRKCLLLGAETGSNDLREWARHELNGYGDEGNLPAYRRFADVPLSVDSMSGNMWSKNQIFTRYQVPSRAREFIAEELLMRQPVETLEALSRSENLSFTSPAMGHAMAVWNSELGPFQSIMGLSWRMSGSAINGVLGQIRTNLTDLVADLTAETPLSELPGKQDVDAAVRNRLGGVVYQTTINNPTGPTAVGAGAKAASEAATADIVTALDAIRDGAHSASASVNVELMAAVDELKATLSDAPEPGAVLAKAGVLRAIAEKSGVGAVSAAVGGVVSALSEMALKGQLG